VLYKDFEDSKDPRDKDVTIRCDSLNKTQKSFNCKMTVPQAVRLATAILQKVQILIDDNIQGGAVKFWNIGEQSKSLACGLDPASKGGKRRKKAISN